MADEPDSSSYCIYFREKKGIKQIGGPNYYNLGGSQFAIDHFIYE